MYVPRTTKFVRMVMLRSTVPPARIVASCIMFRVPNTPVPVKMNMLPAIRTVRDAGSNWTLLDPASLQALQAEPSAEYRVLRLACDVTEEELVESVFVRNALVVLEYPAAEAFVWLTDKGNFGRETVAWMRESMTWPDMEATGSFAKERLCGNRMCGSFISCIGWWTGPD